MVKWVYMRKSYLWALLTLAVLAASPAAGAGTFTYRGTVTNVVDGDTLDVRLTSGKRERIRLIGIDTPERGACYAGKATERARQLAMSKPVVLRGDPSQDTRDRYGRLLAYVWIPGGMQPGFPVGLGRFREGLCVPGRVPAAVRLSQRGGGCQERERRTVEGMRCGRYATTATTATTRIRRGLPPVVLTVPADRRRPRLCRHPRAGGGAGPRSRLRP